MPWIQKVLHIESLTHDKKLPVTKVYDAIRRKPYL